LEETAEQTSRVTGVDTCVLISADDTKTRCPRGLSVFYLPCHVWHPHVIVIETWHHELVRRVHNETCSVSISLPKTTGSALTHRRATTPHMYSKHTKSYIDSPAGDNPLTTKSDRSHFPPTCTLSTFPEESRAKKSAAQPTRLRA
jgi:hypothetical protein